MLGITVFNVIEFLLSDIKSLAMYAEKQVQFIIGFPYLAFCGKLHEQHIFKLPARNNRVQAWFILIKPIKNQGYGLLHHVANFAPILNVLHLS